MSRIEPRIPPLAREHWSLLLRAVLSVTPGGTERPMNIFTTLARHPALFRSWLGFGAGLLAGRLPARDRELAILRTAKRCGCAYEWQHHRDFALEAGLTEDEIASVDPECHDHPWSARDALVLAAVDELHSRNTLSDETWSALAEQYDHARLIELTMLVGHYHMVAFTLNALHVQPEAEPAHPSVSRAPLTRRASWLRSVVRRLQAA